MNISLPKTISGWCMWLFFLWFGIGSLGVALPLFGLITGILASLEVYAAQLIWHLNGGDFGVAALRAGGLVFDLAAVVAQRPGDQEHSVHVPDHEAFQGATVEVAHLGAEVEQDRVLVALADTFSQPVIDVCIPGKDVDLAVWESVWLNVAAREQLDPLLVL